MTALHMAARSGFDEICQLLIKHGIEIDCATEKGVTALSIAIDHEDISIVELLLQHHAGVNRYNIISPLERACRLNNLEIAKLLLKATSLSGVTCVHTWDCQLALFMTGFHGATECVELLLSSWYRTWREPFDVNKCGLRFRSGFLIATRNCE